MRFVLALLLIALPTLAVAGPNDNIADLSWAQVIHPGPVVYHVQVKNEPCALPDTVAWDPIATVSGISNTTYADPAKAEGETFCYRVGAAANVAGDGMADWSNRAEFAVPFVKRPATVLDPVQ